MNQQDKVMFQRLLKSPSAWICFGVTVAYGVFGIVMFLL